MAESTGAPAGATTEVKTPGKVVSAGEPVRGEFKNQQNNFQPRGDNGGSEGAGDAGAGAAAGAGADAGAGSGSEGGKEGGEAGNEGAAGAGGAGAEGQEQELTDDQLKKGLEKRGIKVDSIDSLKPVEKEVELTEEQKKEQEKALEKRMLDTYIANGGTAENFVALKRIAEVDLSEISTEQIKHELKENGFSDEEVNAILVERYYQINPEQLEQGVEETDEEFKARQESIKKKVAYGAKRVQARGQQLKDTAIGALKDLREAIAAQDALVEAERKYSANVDEFFSKVPRKMTLTLGKVNDQETSPVTIDVPEAAVEKVKNLMRDPEQRQQFFFTEDNTLNLEKIGNILLRNEMLESALRAGIVEGGSLQVSEFEKRFPGAAAGLGLGNGKSASQSNGRKGVITQAGEPQVASPANSK